MGKIRTIIRVLLFLRNFLIVSTIGVLSLLLACCFYFGSLSFPIDYFWLATVTGFSAAGAMALSAYYDDFKEMERKLKNA